MKRLCFTLCLAFLVLSCSDFFESEKNETFRKSSEGGNTPFESVDKTYFENINEGDFSLKKVVGNISYHKMLPKIELFRANTILFERKLQTYCEDANTDELPFVQNQWADLMLSFHAVGAVPFGPINENNGLFLKELYAYPFLNQCGIDRQMINLKNGKPLPPNLPFNMQGLSAIEYLLFEPTLRSACNEAAPAIAQWNAQSVEQKRYDRCQLALKLTQEVSNKSKTLTQKWQPQNYPSQLVSQANNKKVLTDIFQGLLELEKLKDFKVAKPMGLHKSCANTLCPEDVEHAYARIGLEAIHVSLQSYYDVFTGGEGYGLDDYLGDINHPEIAEEFEVALLKAIDSAKIAKKSGSFQELLQVTDTTSCKQEDNQQPLCVLFRSVNLAGFIMKTDMLAALSLEVTLPNPGDNDGV